MLNFINFRIRIIAGTFLVLLFFSGCTDQNMANAEVDCVKIKESMKSIDVNDPDMMQKVSLAFKSLWINLEDEKLIETVRNVSRFDPLDRWDIQEKNFDDNMIAIFSYCNQNVEDEFFGSGSKDAK